MAGQKWINEGRVFYPVGEGVVLHSGIGQGVFELYKNPNPQDQRLGLKKLFDKFEFDYKIYDLGIDDFIEKVKGIWNHEEFVASDKNLGILLNGTKGTGKTVAAKILANQMEMPVILITRCYDGIQEFIQNLEFSAVIILDEAEKTFKDTSGSNNMEILLHICDGLYNKARKLFILTTNTLTINENLLGRPGRIRYVKEFGNLSEKAIKEYLDDNLKDPSKRDEILQKVDQLEISTIDILKAIVEEVNWNGGLGNGDDNCMNIPLARYQFSVLRFPELGAEDLEELKEILKVPAKEGNLNKWLAEEHNEVKSSDGGKEDGLTNLDWLCSKFDGWETTMSSQYSYIIRGSKTNLGEVLEGVDEFGIFSTSGSAYSVQSEPLTCVLVKKKRSPSLYGSRLSY